MRKARRAGHPTHQGEGFAELVCSNSFRSDDVGVLHEEMRKADSLIMGMGDCGRRACC